MITDKALDIFYKYNGNVDARFRKSEADIISGDEFYLLNSFIQDIDIIRNGLGSNTFKVKLFRKMIEHCENKAVICRIFRD